jgi:hypothetical protein
VLEKEVLGDLIDIVFGKRSSQKALLVRIQKEHYTGSVERQFERWRALLDVNIKHVIVLFPFVGLFTPRIHCLDDFANLLP